MNHKKDKNSILLNDKTKLQKEIEIIKKLCEYLENATSQCTFKSNKSTPYNKRKRKRIASSQKKTTKDNVSEDKALSKNPWKEKEIKLLGCWE